MKNTAKHLITFILFLLALGWLWFLVGAVTWQSALIGLAGLALTSLPISLWFWWQKRPYFPRLIFLQISFIIGSAIVILVQPPTGQPAEGSPVSNEFVGDKRPFHRYTLPNIVPEKEQINLGYRLMPLVDPYLTRQQARRVSVFTFDLYDEMEADSNFRALGSVMGWAYADLAGRPFNIGHYYLYQPQSVSNDVAKPALVFLHGSGGNFKPYLWIWSKFAEENGYVIIAPSYGFGNWDAEEGVTAVQFALTDAMTKTNIDPDQIYLAGLSNGGLGASRTAAQFPDVYRGVISLSPVMDTQIVDGEAYQGVWNGRKHLIITGEVDKRIPIGYVNNRVTNLQTGGVNVTYHIFPTEDHFLMFSQPDAVMTQISTWLQDK